jgi:hypothetical protein
MDFEVDNGPATDEEIRDRLRKFAQNLRSFGLLGDTAANVGEAREAGDTTPSDGLAPMVNTVRQIDR